MVSPLAVIRFDWPAELVFRSERRCCRPRRSLSPALGGIQEPVKCQKQKMHPNELDARAFFFSLGKRKVRRFKLPVDVHHAAKLMMKAAGSPSRCDGGHRLITFWNGSTQQLFLLLLFLNMKMDGWNRRSGPDIDVLFRFLKKKAKIARRGPEFSISRYLHGWRRSARNQLKISRCKVRNWPFLRVGCWRDQDVRFTEELEHMHRSFRMQTGPSTITSQAAASATCFCCFFLVPLTVPCLGTLSPSSRRIASL